MCDLEPEGTGALRSWSQGVLQAGKALPLLDGSAELAGLHHSH